MTYTLGVRHNRYMEDNTIYLSEADYNQIIEALDTAGEPSPALVELFKKHSVFVDICEDCDGECKVCDANR